jgi:hypothetical protein
VQLENPAVSKLHLKATGDALSVNENVADDDAVFPDGPLVTAGAGVAGAAPDVPKKNAEETMVTTIANPIVTMVLLGLLSLFSVCTEWSSDRKRSR